MKISFRVKIFRSTYPEVCAIFGRGVPPKTKLTENETKRKRNKTKPKRIVSFVWSMGTRGAHRPNTSSSLSGGAFVVGQGVRSFVRTFYAFGRWAPEAPINQTLHFRRQAGRRTPDPTTKSRSDDERPSRRRGGVRGGGSPPG